MLVSQFYSQLRHLWNMQTQHLTIMYMHNTEKLHNFCHGCATAHSMNLQYVQLTLQTWLYYALYTVPLPYINVYKSSVNFGCLTLQTPIFIDVTLLPGCPPGLTLSVNESKCTCYSILTNNVFQCSIQNKIGYLEWKNTV